MAHADAALSHAKAAVNKKRSRQSHAGASWKSIRKKVVKHWQLYLIVAVPVLILLIFSYGPMYGLQIAFQDFSPIRGFSGSDWVGFKHFRTFFSSYQFWRLLKNTLGISVYYLLASFPIPILLAVALNECHNKFYKKTVQMVTYAPYFISTVVMTGIVLMFLSPHSGLVNNFIKLFGGQPIDFMGRPGMFKSIYVWSKIWQTMGYSSIIYLSALSGVDPNLREAAIIDGASRVKCIWHVDLPSILPTIIILLIMNTGSIMNIGYEQILLMQNNVNMSSSDIIATYVYRIGIVNAQYSFSAAVGLFNSVINCIILVVVNQFAKRVGETSLW